VDEIDYEIDDISPARRAFDRATVGAIESLVYFLAGHWLFILNTIHLLIVGVAFVVPVLMHISPGIASPIFNSYHLICHQLPYRSYFLFGYQVAVCQRDVAIYLSLGLGGIAFSFVRTRLRPLSWRGYILLLMPIAVDGFTQLLGLRESDWILRTITGSLFGVATVWLAFPYLQVGMQELRESMGRQ